MGFLWGLRVVGWVVYGVSLYSSWGTILLLLYLLDTIRFWACPYWIFYGSMPDFVHEHSWFKLEHECIKAWFCSCLIFIGSVEAHSCFIQSAALWAILIIPLMLWSLFQFLATWATHCLDFSRNILAIWATHCSCSARAAIWSARMGSWAILYTYIHLLCMHDQSIACMFSIAKWQSKESCTPEGRKELGCIYKEGDGSWALVFLMWDLWVSQVTPQRRVPPKGKSPTSNSLENFLIEFHAS